MEPKQIIMKWIPVSNYKLSCRILKYFIRFTIIHAKGQNTKLILDIKELSNHVTRTDNHYIVICHPNIMTDQNPINKLYECLGL